MDGADDDSLATPWFTGEVLVGGCAEKTFLLNDERGRRRSLPHAVVEDVYQSPVGIASRHQTHDVARQLQTLGHY